MKDKLYLPLKLHNGETDHGKLNLPDGCEGIIFVFKTKASARKIWDKSVPLIQIEKESK